MSTATDRISAALASFQLNAALLTPLKATRYERDLAIVNSIHFFTFAVLLEHLRRHDPVEADRLGDWMNSVFPGTDTTSASVLVRQWLAEMEEGHCPTMPTLPSPETVDEEG